MNQRKVLITGFGLAAIAAIALTGSLAQTAEPKAAAKQSPSSYAPVVIREKFDDTVARMSAEKPDVMKRQMDLLKDRYDLSNRPAQGITMDRGKSVQAGVRVKLPDGVTWQQLANMSAAEIREKGLWP